MRIEAIHWRDIVRSQAAWSKEEDIRGMTPEPCVTVGHVVYEDEDSLRVCASWNTDDDWSLCDCIPITNVVKRVVLCQE